MLNKKIGWFIWLVFFAALNNFATNVDGIDRVAMSDFGSKVIARLENPQQNSEGLLMPIAYGGFSAMCGGGAIGLPIAILLNHGLFTHFYMTATIMSLCTVASCGSFIGAKSLLKRYYSANTRYQHKIEMAKLLNAAYGLVNKSTYDDEVLKKYAKLYYSEQPDISSDEMLAMCRKVALANEAGYFVPLVFVNELKEDKAQSDEENEELQKLTVHVDNPDDHSDVIKNIDQLSFIGKLADYNQSLQSTLNRLFKIKIETIYRDWQDFKNYWADDNG